LEFEDEGEVIGGSFAAIKLLPAICFYIHIIFSPIQLRSSSSDAIKEGRILCEMKMKGGKEKFFFKKAFKKVKKRFKLNAQYCERKKKIYSYIH
jgi:hypothetical protein